GFDVVHFVDGLLFGHIPDGAGIEQDDIGFALMRRLGITTEFQLTRDLVGVAFVHLAAVSLDEKGRHEGKDYLFRKPRSRQACQRSFAPVEYGVEFTLEMGICLGLLALAVGLFVWEKIPADITALLLMSVLLLMGLLTPKDAFTVFSNEAPITVAA